MGIFFKDYEASGPGIAKDAPQKEGGALFFQILFSKAWHLAGINLLHYLFLLPLTLGFAAVSFIKNVSILTIVLILLGLITAVTIGPATAAMTRVIRSFVIQKHTFVFRDFFKAFRANFKKAAIIGVLDMFIFASAIASLYVYPMMAQEMSNKLFYGAMIITLSLALVVIMMNFYIWPMLVATDLSLKDLIKDSFVLAFVGMKTNLLTFVICAVITAAMCVLALAYPSAFLMLIPLIPAALICYIVTFNCYPLIQKYVIDPYYTSLGKVNPERVNDAEAVDEETLFEDMGGKEKPIEGSKKSKPKKIS